MNNLFKISIFVCLQILGCTFSLLAQNTLKISNGSTLKVTDGASIVIKKR